MARVTVEDCLKNVTNRFELVQVTAKRVRQLRKGAKRLVGSNNKDVVEALREIAANRVRPNNNFEVEEEGENSSSNPTS